VSIHDKIAEDLNGIGGPLRCDRCGSERSLGDLAQKLRAGWPECCGETMRWLTDEELSRGVRA
jgi:hypothetical protein